MIRMKPSQAIEKLLAAGLTEAAIGDAVGARQSTVNKIKHGTVPNWDLGRKLIELAEGLDDDEVDNSARRVKAANEGGAAETDGVSVQPLKDAA